MKLSRIDRIQRTLVVADLFPQLDPATVTSVSVGLLPPLGRNGSPTAATTWTAYSVTAGAATVMFVGPEADSTGAVAVPATADLYAKAAGSFGEVEAVLVERITVPGGGAVLPLPALYVASVVGATGAVTGTQIAADPALRAAFEAALTVNVHSYGAKGDGTTDDTAAIQAAINAVQTSTAGAGTVTFPAGTYRLTSELSVSRGGVALVGVSRRATILRQDTVAANGITVNRDVTNGETFTRSFVVANMRIQGAGRPGGAIVSTGVGLNATQPTVYGGQRILMDNVTFSDWDICARLTRWDNCMATALAVEYSRVGWWSDGNGNSHKIIGIAGTNCTETAMRFGDGMGVEVSAQDVISCGMMLDLLNLSQVTLSSYNFESCTGTTFVNVANGATLITNAGRILKNVGNEAPGFTITGGGQLVLLGAIAYSGFTTAKPIRKSDNNATIFVLGPTPWLSSPAQTIVDDVGNMSYPAAPWPVRQDNAVPSGSANVRNMLLAGLTRDTSNASDKLFYYGADRTTGATAYQRHLLTGTLEGAGSPVGVVTAPPGTRYINTNGGAGQTFWTKESGTDSSGWVALATSQSAAGTAAGLAIVFGA